MHVIFSIIKLISDFKYKGFILKVPVKLNNFTKCILFIIKLFFSSLWLSVKYKKGMQKQQTHKNVI